MNNKSGTIIIAGEGELPFLIIKKLKNSNIPFFLLILKNSNWRKSLTNYPNRIVNFGKILSELLALQKKKFNKIIFAGAVQRPSINDIKPDLQTLKLFPKITKVLLKGGDNNLLTFLITQLELLKFKIISIKSFLGDSFLNQGNFTNFTPCKLQYDDICKGKKILASLSKFDIGQSIVMQQGNVIGIEAAEGTNNLIKRSYNLIKSGQKPILVKLKKNKQDLRVDLPTIGIRTIKLCIKYSISGIAFSSQDTLILNKQKIINEMNKYKLFLYGI